jgi:hypothetical protein
VGGWLLAFVAFVFLSVFCFLTKTNRLEYSSILIRVGDNK